MENSAQIADEIRQLYRAEPLAAGVLIERYLDETLKNMTPSEKLAAVKSILGHFLPAVDTKRSGPAGHEELLLQFYSLVLGKRVEVEDLSSTELMQKLAESLNTIFNTLNQMVSIIDLTLYGEELGEETIRHRIGSQLLDDGSEASLDDYLGKIKKAFLTTQTAYQKAAYHIVNKILIELDPDKIANNEGKQFKFGLLRKAEHYETYQAKFQKCNRWFASGRFMRELSNEFEKQCQKMHRR